jgi:hypothetical protein
MPAGPAGSQERQGEQADQGLDGRPGQSESLGPAHPCQSIRRPRWHSRTFRCLRVPRPFAASAAPPATDEHGPHRWCRRPARRGVRRPAPGPPPRAVPRDRDASGTSRFLRTRRNAATQRLRSFPARSKPQEKIPRAGRLMLVRDR